MATGYNLGYKHAEIMALNKVKHKGGAKGMTAVNVRLTNAGTIGISKPCATCAYALKLAGVRSTIYTDRDGTFKAETYQ